MARNPTFQFTCSTMDQSGEIGTFSVNLTSAFDMLSVPAPVTGFLAALANIQDGTLQKYQQVLTRKVHNDGYAPDGNREDKLEVTYEDSVTLAVFQNEIPCRNNSIPTVPGSDEFDLDQAAIAAFVTAWEALVVSPDGNITNVLAIRLVGRNV